MLKKLFKFKVLGGVFALSLVFVIAAWFWAYVSLKDIPQPLIIHYSEYAGIDQIGSLWSLAAVAVFGLAVVVMNFLIAVELEERDALMGKLVAGLTLFFAILIFIGFAAIIGVNT